MSAPAPLVKRESMPMKVAGAAPIVGANDVALVPTFASPMQGLPLLAKVAVVGRARIVELAERPVVWLWDNIATSGLSVLLAAGPGCGKTTLLFQLVAARANCGAATNVLGRMVQPAPAGRYVVVVEAEHSDESAARILRKSCAMLDIDEAALDKIILVARGNVRIGSDTWSDILTLIGAGLVSDVVLDTLGRTAPSDANDEREQIEVFSLIAQAIERAPSADTRPTFWIAAHTRKVDGMPTLNDVSGSTQRVGQADVVLLMGATRSGEKVASVRVAFGKVREKDAEDWPEPVEYVISKQGIRLLDAPAIDDRPLEERIAARLAAGPQTASALKKALGRSHADIQVAISNLFAARQIESTEIPVRGKPAKAFALRGGSKSGGTLEGLAHSRDVAGPGGTRS